MFGACTRIILVLRWLSVSSPGPVAKMTLLLWRKWFYQTLIESVVDTPESMKHLGTAKTLGSFLFRRVEIGASYCRFSAWTARICSVAFDFSFSTTVACSPDSWLRRFVGRRILWCYQWTRL